MGRINLQTGFEYRFTGYFNSVFKYFSQKEQNRNFCYIFVQTLII